MKEGYFTRFSGCRISRTLEVHDRSKEATGELLEIERLTSSLERGHGKSTRKGNSLVAYSTACPVRGALDGNLLPKCSKALSFDPMSLYRFVLSGR